MSSPLTKLHNKNLPRWEVMVDFPEWEIDHILNWIHALLYPSDRWGHRSFAHSILTGVQSRERVMIHQDIGIPIENWIDLQTTVAAMIRSDDPELNEKTVIFLELLVKYVRDTQTYYEFGSSRSTVKDDVILELLEKLLRNGSKWTIVNQEGAEAGLIERVNPQLTEIAKSTENPDLFKAWNFAFGAKPEPELAIVHAQSAIEHISSKRGLTNATSKVYGSIIGDIKTHKGAGYQSISKPEFDVTLALGKRSGSEIDDEFALWFSTTMDLIQKSNPNRHKSSLTENFEVSLGAARQAVLLATTIYEVIDKKYIVKK